MSQEDMESKVYSVRTAEDDHKLVDITAEMQKLATMVLVGYASGSAVVIVDHASMLANKVVEFLKVSGWSRS